MKQRPKCSCGCVKTHHRHNKRTGYGKCKMCAMENKLCAKYSPKKVRYEND